MEAGEATAGRWFVDVSAWTLNSPEWQNALQTLPEHERLQVTRFVFAKDRHLALASRLLQRHVIRELFALAPDQAVAIQRTPENKPFWGQHDALSRRRPPLWNYNVSHHGTTVVLACDPHALVGVDVVQLTDRPRGNRTSQSFFRAFQDHFTVREWAFVYANEDDEDAQYRAFYTLWSLKESLIKALGIGLGFSLQRAEFVLQEHDDLWMLQLDGQLRQDWRFESTQIGATHVATVALGPLEAMHSPETSCVLPCGNLTSSALALHTAKARLEFRNNSTIGFEAVPWQCCDLLHGQRTDS